jgi:hypothetical protein
MAQALECLPSKCKVLSSNPILLKEKKGKRFKRRKKKNKGKIVISRQKQRVAATNPPKNKIKRHIHHIPGERS